jgi:tetratricopeptide (TPR) repeat protein
VPSTLIGLSVICAALISFAAVAQPIDQVPMYGGMDRSAQPALKAADEKLIEGTTKHYGSRENASAAFVNNGFAYYNRDDLINAMRRFNQAWLLDPNNPQAYWGFGAVLHDQGKNCEAMKFFEKALSFGRFINGMYPDAARVISLCAVSDKSLSSDDRTRLVDRADALYADAAERDQNKGYVYASWATAYYWRGQYAEAWHMVKRARETGGGLPDQFMSLLRAKMAEP